MGKKHTEPQDEPREDTPNEGEDPSNVATEPATPEEQIGQLLAANEELKLQWARAQADYQNLRRRAQSDYEAGVRRKLQPLFEDLLQVLDYLDMALASPATTQETKNLTVGVEMTRQQFIQALERQDVREIETSGLFDPKLHEAAKGELRNDVPPGTILAVVRKGYRWHDEVLRFANVVVAQDEHGELPEIVGEA